MIDKRGNSRSDIAITNKRYSMSKRSQSQIVSTVLLILLVIAAAVIIFGFVIPFVKDKLASGDCLDVAGKVEISSSQYTCYDSNGNMSVQVHILEIADLIDGFAIELGGPSSKTVKIINNSDDFDSEFFMHDNAEFSLPKSNEERTYIIPFSEKPTLIRVYPILKGGKVCGISDSVIEIDDC